jgi:hypothetical protein
MCESLTRLSFAESLACPKLGRGHLFEARGPVITGLELSEQIRKRYGFDWILRAISLLKNPLTDTLLNFTPSYSCSRETELFDGRLDLVVKQTPVGDHNNRVEDLLVIALETNELVPPARRWSSTCLFLLSAESVHVLRCGLNKASFASWSEQPYGKVCFKK